MRGTGFSRSDVRPIHFLIMAGPLLLFMLNPLIIQRIGVPVLPVDASILRADGDFLEAAGRSRFFAGCLFMSMIVVLALVAFAVELAGPLTRRSRALALGVFALTQIPVWTSILAHQRAGEAVWRSYHQLGDGVMAAVLARGRVPVCEEGARLLGVFPCGPEPGLTLFRTLLDLLNALSGAGVAALVLGMILCLGRPRPPAGIPARVYHLGRAQLVSRRFLYLAGLLLTSGMFVTISWMHWPLPLVRPELRADYRAVLDALLLYSGVFYTMLILIGFGPVLLVQARQADRLAMEALREGGAAIPSVRDLQRWKEEAGLAVSEVQMLQNLLAAGAPLMAGVAGSFAPF
ncbi:hypothetical protein [Poseidonocella sedimentorum]|uniref:Uncharacterized protein n=1 Tax=Poseidonocella sedimentorum TaxID=871652 RepID=A0A1I6CNW4_9RHOB|nr:hypothetical protein [Poseidonocella sedimentorum]SFQ94863.1 hypothetical protein SAMN04515673_101110 [Poseidonocella sedimentorum]